MPADEKQISMSFIWAGCDFHKNLKTVKGGYAAILQWWKNNQHISGLILLPNCDNASMFKNTSGKNLETEDQQLALTRQRVGE